MPAGLYGCFFCTMTCLSLLATIACWRSSPIIVWSLTGWSRALSRPPSSRPGSPCSTVSASPGWDIRRVGLRFCTGCAVNRCRVATLSPRRLPFSPPPGLLKLSGIGLVHTTDDARSRRVDGNLDGLHFFRQLSEGLSPYATTWAIPTAHTRPRCPAIRWCRSVRWGKSGG